MGGFKEWVVGLVAEGWVEEEGVGKRGVWVGLRNGWMGGFKFVRGRRG